MKPSHLSVLFSEFPFPVEKNFGSDPQILALTADSRQAQPGSLFVATSGGLADGHQFIPDAVERGAVAVVGDQVLSGLAVPYLRVENARQSLAHLAAAFYGYPARKLTMIGVTGTDGKTTTSNILYRILLAAGYKTGMISTVNAVIGDEILDTGFHVTTPDAPEVQHYLSRMVSAGLTHVVLETTSHGWAQFRVDACEFDIGVVTNITILIITALMKTIGLPRLGYLHLFRIHYLRRAVIFVWRSLTRMTNPIPICVRFPEKFRSVMVWVDWQTFAPMKLSSL